MVTKSQSRDPASARTRQQRLARGHLASDQAPLGLVSSTPSGTLPRAMASSSCPGRALAGICSWRASEPGFLVAHPMTCAELALPGCAPPALHRI